MVIPISQMRKLRFKARKWQIQDQNLFFRVSVSCPHEVDETTAVQSGPAHSAREGKLGFGCTNASGSVKSMGWTVDSGDFNWRHQFLWGWRE